MAGTLTVTGTPPGTGTLTVTGTLAVALILAIAPGLTATLTLTRTLLTLPGSRLTLPGSRLALPGSRLALPGSRLTLAGTLRALPGTRTPAIALSLSLSLILAVASLRDALQPHPARGLLAGALVPVAARPRLAGNGRLRIGTRLGAVRPARRMWLERPPVGGLVGRTGWRPLRRRRRRRRRPGQVLAVGFAWPLAGETITRQLGLSAVGV